MKTFAFAAFVAALALAGPAFAQKTTVKYAITDGPEYVVTYDSTAGMATLGDKSAPYTFDQATKTLCSASPDGTGEVCVTFAEVQFVAGHTTAFTTSTGRAGTATVVGVEP
jgi:hypothetical protein